MSAALPVAAVVTGEIRALTLYDECPLNCGAVLVRDDAFAPHLRPGELAIVDPDDNEPQAGEIYLITVNSPRDPGGVALHLVQLRAKVARHGRMRPNGDDAMDDEDTLGWWMHFGLIRPRPVPFCMDRLVADLRSGRERICDGPMNTDGMRRKIVGRVIGIRTPMATG